MGMIFSIKVGYKAAMLDILIGLFSEEGRYEEVEIACAQVVERMQGG